MPDSLWRYLEFGKGKKYSDNQAEGLAKEVEFLAQFDAWTDALSDSRAKDAKPPWRDVRMRLGGAEGGRCPDGTRPRCAKQNTERLEWQDLLWCDS